MGLRRSTASCPAVRAMGHSERSYYGKYPDSRPFCKWQRIAGMLCERRTNFRKTSTLPLFWHLITSFTLRRTLPVGCIFVEDTALSLIPYVHPSKKVSVVSEALGEKMLPRECSFSCCIYTRVFPRYANSTYTYDTTIRTVPPRISPALCYQYVCWSRPTTGLISL